ncbi:phosphopantothenoylcysteine decarboxylase [Aureococcus anophagefferens]|uniref:Phosphopantothenoylcysteine decarboxylase n=1 Tax=Aureococcus anophagefferens TaxID=44056 RepID=A0ABR1FLK3_AURAN
MHLFGRSETMDRGTADQGSLLGAVDEEKEASFANAPPSLAETADLALRNAKVREMLQAFREEGPEALSRYVDDPSNSALDASGIEVLSDADEWDAWQEIGDDVVHVELRKWADLLVVAPLSAKLRFAKLANGLCDDLLSCTARAWDFDKPFVVAPAMNTAMWSHPLTATHLADLRVLGVAAQSALAPGDAVGVCLTGMERTLLEAPVVASFDKYVRRPVVAAGATLDAFVVLADGAGTPLGVAEHEGRERHREHRGEALFADVRAAGASSRALRASAAKRRSYAWLYRLRTDTVFFLEFAPFRMTPDEDATDLVYVPFGGMSSGRSLHGRGDAAELRAAEEPESPAPPRNDTVPQNRVCCGDVRELRIPYAIAREGAAKQLECSRLTLWRAADASSFKAASFVPAASASPRLEVREHRHVARCNII